MYVSYTECIRRSSPGSSGSDGMSHLLRLMSVSLGVLNAAKVVVEGFDSGAQVTFQHVVSYSSSLLYRIFKCSSRPIYSQY